MTKEEIDDYFPKKIIRYQTSDGQLWKTLKLANEHETLISSEKYKKELELFNSEFKLKN